MSKYTAQVINKLPNQQYEVRKDNGDVVRCVCKGHIDRNNIRILIGDTVKVEEIEHGEVDRITYRVT